MSNVLQMEQANPKHFKLYVLIKALKYSSRASQFSQVSNYLRLSYNFYISPESGNQVSRH